MVFTFLNVWETSKEYFVTHENDKKFRFNEVVSEHSHVHSLACHLRLHSSHSSTVGELKSLRYLPPGPSQKRFAEPDLKDHFPNYL